MPIVAEGPLLQREVRLHKLPKGDLDSKDMSLGELLQKFQDQLYDELLIMDANHRKQRLDGLLRRCHPDKWGDTPCMVEWMGGLTKMINRAREQYL